MSEPLVEGAGISLRENGFGLDDTLTIGGMDTTTAPYSQGCNHCGTKLRNDRDAFEHRGFRFCIECLGSLLSWRRDGGIIEDPDQFAYILDDQDRDWLDERSSDGETAP